MTEKIVLTIDKSYYTRMKNGKLEHVHDKRIKHSIDNPGREVRITKEDVRTAFTRGTVGIISAGRNTNSEEDMQLTDAQIAERDKALEYQLKKDGREYISAKGVWEGSEERSYIVALPKADRSYLIKLGIKFNQDSIIFVDRGKNEYIYTTGPNKGMEHTGSGFDEVPIDAVSGYTEVEAVGASPYKFALDLDFDHTSPLKKSYTISVFEKSDYMRYRNNRYEYVHDSRVRKEKQSPPELDIDTRLQIWDLELAELSHKEKTLSPITVQGLIDISRRKSEIYTEMISTLEAHIKLSKRNFFDYSTKDIHTSLVHDISVKPRELIVKRGK